MTHNCIHCKKPFEGRPNRQYCSQTCRAATNNRRYNDSRQQARSYEAKIRANRSLLAKLHKFFGEQALPHSVITATSLDLNANTGVSSDENTLCFLDFLLQKCPNNHYKIIKLKDNV